MKPNQDQALRAVVHITHDVWLMSQANGYRGNRLGWTAWYALARNVNMFLNDKGNSTHMRAKDFLGQVKDGTEAANWRKAREAILKKAPAEYTRLSADASQAVSHLSWRRVTDPDVQEPSPDVTTFLLDVWNAFCQNVPEPYRTAFAKEWERLNGGLSVDTSPSVVIASGMLNRSSRPGADDTK